MLFLTIFIQSRFFEVGLFELGLYEVLYVVSVLPAVDGSLPVPSLERRCTSLEANLCTAVNGLSN